MFQIETKTFEKLSTFELHEIFQLRQNIFIVEQNCVYPDIDGLDPMALHCLLKNETGKICAYTRLFDKGQVYENYSVIGRVVCHKDYRKLGYGREIMKYSINKNLQLFPDVDIKIGAQLYLKNFYESLGFKQVSEPYLEDGILHIYMIHQK
jgi:ElaA protein